MTQYDLNVILTIIGHKKKRMKFLVTIMISWETNLVNKIDGYSKIGFGSLTNK